MPEPLIISRREGAVLVLTLNRPEAMNSWSEQLEELYFELLDRAEADPEVGAVVLTGNGRAFCAGADFADLEQLVEGTPAGIEGKRPRCRPLYFKKPLIAALNGATAGLGLVEALYCDVRFCVPEAKVTTAFARRGLVAEYGTAWLLPRLVGAGRARELLLSGRVLLGTEAKEVGLVEFLVDAEELVAAAVRYAAEIATQCSPASVAVMKGQLLDSLDSDFEAAFVRAEKLLRESLLRPDLGEGLASFMERRPPEFLPLDPSLVGAASEQVDVG